MSRTDDLVIAYLEALHRHRALVAGAYHQGRIEGADETATPRGLQELRRHRALVPLEQDTFRLASSLARHLDEVLQKEQLFAAVGGNIADLAARLPLLIDEAVKAHLEGRVEDLDGYVDAFNNAVFDLADHIGGALQSLRMLADTRFASVGTLAEKQRQNAWYIGRAERIGEAIKSLQTGGLLERLEEEPAAAPLLPAFRGPLWERLPAWRESLLDITEILKAYLYRLRQVEPAGRRLRAFNLFLKRHPEYAAPDLEELTEPPLWATRAAPLRLLAHPDLLEGATHEALIEVAAKLPPSPTVVKRAPKVGTLTLGADREPGVLTIPPRPDQLALRRLLAEVPEDGEPLSVLAWKRAHPEYADLPDPLWLHCVLYEETLARRRTGHLRFERLELPPSHPLSGNITVRDVLVRRADVGTADPEPSMSNLTKLTVCALLRVVQSAGERFPGSGVLKTFSDGYRIGRTKGAALLFDAHDKARIRELSGVEGIDPSTDPGAWDRIDRAEALHLGPNEKFAATPVKRQRVAIKTLPGRPLTLDGQALDPPARLPPERGRSRGRRPAGPRERPLGGELGVLQRDPPHRPGSLAGRGEPAGGVAGRSVRHPCRSRLGVVTGAGGPRVGLRGLRSLGSSDRRGAAPTRRPSGPGARAAGAGSCAGSARAFRGAAPPGGCGAGRQHERAGAPAVGDPAPPWTSVTAGALSEGALCAPAR